MSRRRSQYGLEIKDKGGASCVDHSTARDAENAALTLVVFGHGTIGSGEGTGTCEVLN